MNGALGQNLLFLYFWCKWFLFCHSYFVLFCHSGAFYLKFANLNFKAIFHKIENLVVAAFYHRNNLLILPWNFLELFIIIKCTNKVSPQIFIFWLVVMATAKMVFNLLPWQPVLTVKNLFWSTQNQNIKLINPTSFLSSKHITLSWDKML